MGNNAELGQEAKLPKKMGRPTKFSKSLALDICKQIAQGTSLVKICKQEGMPDYSTILDWLCREDEPFKDFSLMYARAKEDQADYLAEEIIDIADDSSKDTAYDEKGNPYCDNEWVQRSKLRVDARKWIASKLKPKKYSERINTDVTSDGKPIVTIIAGSDPYQDKAKNLLPAPNED